MPEVCDFICLAEEVCYLRCHTSEEMELLQERLEKSKKKEKKK